MNVFYLLGFIEFGLVGQNLYLLFPGTGRRKMSWKRPEFGIRIGSSKKIKQSSTFNKFN